MIIAEEYDLDISKALGSGINLSGSMALALIESYLKRENSLGMGIGSEQTGGATVSTLPKLFDVTLL